MDQVAESDHLIVLVDNTEYGDAVYDMIGIAELGGKIAYVQADGYSTGFLFNRKWLPDYHQMSTVAVHEFLHNMGLKDLYDEEESKQIPGNYMMRYNPLKVFPTLTVAQLQEAIQSEHNTGTNYSYEGEVRDESGSDTTERDPRKKSTKGKKGKIPKILM